MPDDETKLDIDVALKGSNIVIQNQTFQCILYYECPICKAPLIAFWKYNEGQKGIDDNAVGRALRDSGFNAYRFFESKNGQGFEYDFEKDPNKKHNHMESTGYGYSRYGGSSEYFIPFMTLNPIFTVNDMLKAALNDQAVDAGIDTPDKALEVLEVLRGEKAAPYFKVVDDRMKHGKPILFFNKGKFGSGYNFDPKEKLQAIGLKLNIKEVDAGEVEENPKGRRFRIVTPAINAGMRYMKVIGRYYTLEEARSNLPKLKDAYGEVYIRTPENQQLENPEEDFEPSGTIVPRFNINEAAIDEVEMNPKEEIEFKYRFDDKDFKFIYIKLKGETIGQLIYNINHKLKQIRVHELLVDEKYQNRGFGSAAMKQIITGSEETGYPIFLSATPMIVILENKIELMPKLERFYKRLNFKPFNMEMIYIPKSRKEIKARPNPTAPEEINKAKAVVQRFTAKKAEKLTSLDLEFLKPDFIKLCDSKTELYESDKWIPEGTMKYYYHPWRDGHPRATFITSDHKWLIGLGKCRVTKDGIEDFLSKTPKSTVEKASLGNIKVWARLATLIGIDIPCGKCSGTLRFIPEDGWHCDKCKGSVPKYKIRRGMVLYDERSKILLSVAKVK